MEVKKRQGSQMNMPRLEISHQDAEIEVKTHKAKVEISSKTPRFNMKRNNARFIMDKQLPTMHIDRTGMYKALGIGPVLQAARQFYEDSVQKGVAGIGAIAAQGTQMMEIEKGGNAIADIGAQTLDKQGDLNALPMPPPEINWEPGYININWSPGSLDLEWDVSTWADIRVEPSYIEIRMVKYPDVKIRVIYDNEGRKPGGEVVDKYL